MAVILCPALNAGYEVVAIDNLYNSKLEAIRRVEKITGKRLNFIRRMSVIIQHCKNI